MNAYVLVRDGCSWFERSSYKYGRWQAIGFHGGRGVQMSWRAWVGVRLSAVLWAALAGCGIPDEPREAFASEPSDGVVAEGQELANYSVSTNASVYWPGSTITLYWQAPSNHNPRDWVGVYVVGSPNTSFGTWSYVPFGSSGSLTFTAPSADGNYEIRYLLDNGYTSAAVSNPFVVSTPTICRDLRSGDPYHPTWIRCCDSVDKVYSYWTRSDGFANWYTGSCWSWGLRP